MTIRIRPRWQRILRIPLAAWRVWRLGHLPFLTCLRLALQVAVLDIR